jgi:corrinoid protein of di/trimethylamine methyltransferase
MASKEELLEQLKNGVVKYQEDVVKDASQQALDEGYAPLEMIMDGLSAGMDIVGELHASQEYFVPEVLMCADALNAGLSILRPHIPTQEESVNAQVVLGTIQGDVHDIGKNMVKMMFDVAGWQVHDLGRDVPLEKFVEEQVRTNSEVVAISAMMTTTMMGMKKLVKMIKAENPAVGIMLGGAPVTKEVVKLFGAHGYAESAGQVVPEAIRMLDQLRELQGRN